MRWEYCLSVFPFTLPHEALSALSPPSQLDLPSDEGVS